MTPLEMITSLRYWIDEPNEGHWGNVELMRRLNEASRRVVRAVQNIDDSFFVVSTQITLVAGQALYDLPKNARTGTRWAYGVFQDTGGAPLDYVYDIRLRDQVPLNVLSSSQPSDVTFGVSFEGGQVRVSPTPSEARTNAIRFYYAPSWGDFHQGTVADVTATTLTFPQSPTYRQGDVSIFDDWYNGMTVQIIAGAGIGQERTISDYAGGSTRQATVATWSTNPTTASTYAVICPVPEDHHDVVVLEAALDASAKRPSKAKIISELLKDKRDEMLSWVSERETFRYDTVEPTDLGH